MDAVQVYNDSTRPSEPCLAPESLRLDLTLTDVETPLLKLAQRKGG